MKTEKIHLTPRQILNRYRTGKYTDDCADNISAAVSVSGEDFCNTAIPIQYCWPETVISNIELALRAMNNPSNAEEILSPVTDSVARNMLMDLATSGILKCLVDGGNYYVVLFDRTDLKCKYPFYDSVGTISDLCFEYKNMLEGLGIDHIKFCIVMMHFIKGTKQR